MSSNYPNGFLSGVTIRGVPITQMHSGEVFWVNNSTTVLAKGAVGGSNGNKGTYTQPFSTIDYAIGKCTASRGDIIAVMPGHAESVSAAGDITCDVAGVAIVGLGHGSARPIITFDTATTADIEIDAANVTISNIKFVCGIDSLAAPIDVDAAICTIANCSMFNNSTLNTIRWILGDANADDLIVEDCRHYGTGVAGDTAFITLNGSDSNIIRGCTSTGDFAAANVEVVTAKVTSCLITENHFENLNAVDVNIEAYAASTGWISNNKLRIATDSQVTWINTGGEMSLFENYGVNNDAETGLICGTVSA